MRILWIEDKGEIVKTSIFDKKIFKSFWTKAEVENLDILKTKLSEEYKYELQEYSTALFLASDLEEAWEIIEENEAFDKIIIDIEFLAEDFNFDNKYIKDSFDGTEEEFEKLFNYNEYMGFITAHLIVSYYKDEYRWDSKDIEENIVFFSANSLTHEDFGKKIKSMYQKEFIYDTDARDIRQFNKNKENDFLKWLKVDDYSIILDRYIKNKKAKKQSIKRLHELIKVIETDALEKSIDDYFSMARKIQENLLLVIPNLESTRGVSDILKELHPRHGEQLLSDRYYHLGNMIQRLTSKNSHEYLEDDENMLKSVIYALLSMIVKIDKIILSLKST